MKNYSKEEIAAALVDLMDKVIVPVDIVDEVSEFKNENLKNLHLQEIKKNFV